MSIPSTQLDRPASPSAQRRSKAGANAGAYHHADTAAGVGASAVERQQSSPFDASAADKPGIARTPMAIAAAIAESDASADHRAAAITVSPPHASARSSPARIDSSTPPGALERMPKWLICVPLVFQWLYLSLRFGGATIPGAANPGITAGGLVGEGKLEYFRQMGPIASAATAPWAALHKDGEISDEAIAAAMSSAGLSFPLIVKPDLGLCGYGVRKVDDLAALREYIAAFPLDQTMVLQRYLPDSNEAGIFYVRDPRSRAGRIIGLALRHFPSVTGDGRSTVTQLMAANARTRRLQGPAHRVRIDGERVPAAGETVRLSTIGSTRVGGLYLDGRELITPALVAAIDAIARDMGEFHFGRFDVRFGSPEALRQGRGFSIMEVNGAGSEAIEAWDPATGLLAGFRMIFAKQRLLFEIGARNHRRGTPLIGLRNLARLNAQQNRLLDAYPPSN